MTSIQSGEGALLTATNRRLDARYQPLTARSLHVLWCCPTVAKGGRSFRDSFSA